MPRPIEEMAAQIPTAVAWRSGGKALDAIARLSANIADPPRPWISRAPISISSPVESAATTAPMAKTTTPPMNTLRRPRMSPSRPQVITVAASIRRYAFCTHCRPASDRPRSLSMTGNASTTSVESSMSTNSPRQEPTSTHHVRPGLIRRTELDWPTGG